MRDHELPIRRIALAGVLILGTVVGVASAVLLWLGHDDAGQGQRGLQPATLATGAPALQSAPQPDLAAYRAQQQGRLHGAGWVDRRAGIVHIPIEDAMALLAARGAKAAASEASDAHSATRERK